VPLLRAWVGQERGWLGRLLWFNEAASSLRSNIPQTALVATLDTYDFNNTLLIISKWSLNGVTRSRVVPACCRLQFSVVTTVFSMSMLA
jgi:hypothetical protein